MLIYVKNTNKLNTSNESVFFINIFRRDTKKDM